MTYYKTSSLKIRTFSVITQVFAIFKLPSLYILYEPTV